MLNMFGTFFLKITVITNNNGTRNTTNKFIPPELKKLKIVPYNKNTVPKI